MRFADLDAVTVDGYGTLVTLRDPAGALVRALAEHGVERSEEDAAAAFAAEASYYRPRSHLGRDDSSLAELRRECVAVFLREARAALDPDTFVEAFIGALRFEPVAGARETLGQLRARGLRLAVVANWDRSLHEHLEQLGLAELFDTIVTSAEAGAAKPDPAPFRLALERLGVQANRSLHVGDEPADEEGARAAGMHFAPAPLQTAFQGFA
jgi:putative hydrolase of the HAD superfamily